MINILIGSLCILAGIITIIIYIKLVRENKRGSTVKLLGAGIGALLIGLYLIKEEIN